MNTEIQPATAVSEQIKQILSNRINACRQALQSSNPHEGVHEARKQLKKIRAIVRIVRDDLSKQEYLRTNAYFRDIARLLSDARDTAALLELTQSLHKVVEEPALKSSFEWLKRHFMAKKAAVSRYQFNQDHLLRHTLIALEPAEDFVQTLQIKHQGFDAFAQSIQRTYQRCKRMKDASKKHPDPETFHEWRKRVKYLRYQISALSPCWPTFLNAFEDELHQLTDHLGSDHDLFVLHLTIMDPKQNNSRDWTALLHFIASQRKGHESKAHQLGDKLFYWKSSQFIGWLREIWTASQPAEPIPSDSLVEV